MNLSLRNKLVVLLLIFAIVPTATVSVLAFDTFEDISRESTLESLQGLARAKAEAIDQFTDSRKKDLQRIAELLAQPVQRLREAESDVRDPTKLPDEPLPELEDAEKVRSPGSEPAAPEEDDAGETGEVEDETEEQPAEPPAAAPVSPAVSEARADLQRTLGLVLGEQATFEELLIIAPGGRVVVSTFSEHEGKTAEGLEYFKRGRATTYVQPVFTSPITEQLTMVIATPIRTQENEDLGVLAARLNLKRFFRLINDTTGLGKTGETLVGKKIGDRVVLMAPTRHDDDAALERTFPVSESGSPIVAATRGDQGAGVVEDYRGERVLTAWTFAPALEWGVVTKIDANEARRPLDEVQNRLLLITLLVVAFAVLASLAFARAMIRPLGELKEATERISKGDLDVELDIRSRDEIGELADSFERMVAAIKFFREDKEERDLAAKQDADPDRG